MAELKGYWVPRLLALVLSLVGIPLGLGLQGFLQDVPVVAGEPAPRTVIAPERVQVADPEETERLRRQAEAEVEPVVQEDLEALTAIVQRVQDAFATAQAAREPGPDGTIPSDSDQVATLTERLPMLDDDGVERLVALTDSQLSSTREEAIRITQDIAGLRILPEEVEEIADGRLQTELALGAFPPGVAQLIVDPIIRDALQPTFTVDERATAQRRAEAAAAIDDVEVTFQRGTAIVTAGEPVTDVQLEALRRLGLEGASPALEMARAAGLAVIITGAVALFLRVYRPLIWANSRHLLLVSVLLVLLTTLLAGIKLIDQGGNERFFALPVGAIAMLATILFDVRIGLLLVVPATALVAYAVPGAPGLVPFIAVSGLISLPLVKDLSARGQLRQAAWQSTVAYVVLAAALNLIFKGTDRLLLASLAGLINGILGAVIVTGLLPFLESVFNVLTATSLIDFKDRNHPLLRELEQKALGTYNHSSMVANMAARACRLIGADHLLAEVMALYHDIGKIAKPYFFVENQYGIANPHDELGDPRQSALIIQRHVTDGVEMATVHKLPPEIVDGIRTHHGTTIVAYFYRQAVQQAAAEELPEPDEDFYRYKGRKPFTREQAVLMLADCTEGATRAAALSDRNLSRDTIQAIVHGLIEDRVKDGQLDDSPLTFAELRTVEESLIESLVGVYHPRITYPEDPKKKAKEVADAARAELTGTGEPAPAAGSTPAPEREPAPVSRIPHPSTRGPRGGAQPR